MNWVQKKEILLLQKIRTLIDMYFGNEVTISVQNRHYKKILLCHNSIQAIAYLEYNTIKMRFKDIKINIIIDIWIMYQTNKIHFIKLKYMML